MERIKRERTKQIIENLYSVRDKFDTLTRSVLEYCVGNDTTHSYTNLVTFVSKFKDTSNIISKFNIVDASQVILRVDMDDYEDFIQTKYIALFTKIFDIDKVKYLVKFYSNYDCWYEVIYETPKSINGGRIVLHGKVGKIEDIDIEAYGIIVDPFIDTIQKISDNNDKIIRIVKENNRKRYYVEKSK